MNRTEYDDVKANLIKKSLERNKTDVYVPVERRKSKDARQVFINVMCFCLCALFVINMAIIEKAGKSISNISQNGLLWGDLELWDVKTLYIAFYIAVISIITSIFCITFCIIPC